MSDKPHSVSRTLSLDVLRGIAMVWMTVFHFCFDLNHFGWLHQSFYTDPFWTWQRSAIVSLFLFCVGWSQAVSSGTGFWRRWLEIAAGAGMVSLGSYAMYPKSWIYFGVLHGIAAMLLVVWLLRRMQLSKMHYLVLAAVSSMLCAFSPVAWNAAPWNILGLISVKPVTEDYLPLLPWFAVVCVGLAFGLHQLGREQGEKKGLNLWLNPFVSVAQPLSVLGRYSLSYYLLHQPVMIGAMLFIRFWL